MEKRRPSGVVFIDEEVGNWRYFNFILWDLCIVCLMDMRICVLHAHLGSRGAY